MFKSFEVGKKISVTKLKRFKVNYQFEVFDAINYSGLKK